MSKWSLATLKCPIFVLVATPLWPVSCKLLTQRFDMLIVPLFKAYAAACMASVNATLVVPLTLPSFWPGSVNVQLNTPATVVLVGFGGMLGGSALWLLSNM
jgi:hypothetical protein